MPFGRMSTNPFGLQYYKPFPKSLSSLVPEKMHVLRFDVQRPTFIGYWTLALNGDGIFQCSDFKNKKLHCNNMGEKYMKMYTTPFAMITHSQKSNLRTSTCKNDLVVGCS